MRVTAAKIAANRANALKSSGPKTDKGKEVSRGNALKHGLTANVIALPDEDQFELDAGLEAWVEETAVHSQIAAELAAQAFRSMVRLRRCERAVDAGDAARVRRAAALWKVQRAREIHEAVALLEQSPAVAVATLRTTAEGAKWLARAWCIILREFEMGHWDEDMYVRAWRLLGLEGMDHVDLHAATQLLAPLSELAKALGTTIHQVDRETIEAKVRDDRRPQAVRVLELGRAGIDTIRGILAEGLDDFERLAEELAPLSEQDEADAAAWCLLDTTPEGRLPRRYLSEAERQVRTTYKLALDVERQAREALAAEAQPSPPEAPAATPGDQPAPAEPPARNEPKADDSEPNFQAPETPPTCEVQPFPPDRIDPGRLRQAV